MRLLRLLLMEILLLVGMVGVLRMTMMVLVVRCHLLLLLLLIRSDKVAAAAPCDVRSAPTLSVHHALVVGDGLADGQAGGGRPGEGGRGLRRGGCSASTCGGGDGDGGGGRACLSFPGRRCRSETWRRSCGATWSCDSSSWLRRPQRWRP